MWENLFSVIKKTAYVITNTFFVLFTPLHFQIKIKFPSWGLVLKLDWFLVTKVHLNPFIFSILLVCTFFNKVSYGVLVFPASSKNFWHGLAPCPNTFFFSYTCTHRECPKYIIPTTSKNINLFVALNEWNQYTWMYVNKTTCCL